MPSRCLLQGIKRGMTRVRQNVPMRVDGQFDAWKASVARGS